MEEYKPNSFKYKAEQQEKAIEKVTKGEVKAKKKANSAKLQTGSLPRMRLE